jgi:peroxiredoxin
MEATLAPGASPQTLVAEIPRGLPVGTLAPSFSLDDLNGRPIALDALRAIGKPVLAIFSSPHCGPCTTLLPDIARWQRDLANSFTVVVVASGTASENRAKIGDLGIDRVLLDTDRAVATMYQGNRTPAAVIIRTDGTIGAALTGGAEAIRRLVAAGTVTPLPMSGAPAPAFALPSLDGRQVTATEFAGQELLLLFWSPACGFCRRMLPELRAWLESRTNDDPHVVLVSSGSVEENRSMGIDAPILLDQGFATGRAFGARGTPAAILVAADGTVASKLAAGAPAIFDLLGASPLETGIPA